MIELPMTLTTFLTPAAPGFTTYAVEYDANNAVGAFTFTNIPAGNYILCIKRPGYLLRTMNVTITDADPFVISLESADSDKVFNLWWGDVNNDFVVDPIDFMALYGKISQEITVFDAGYDPNYDLNADGVIDPVDVMAAYGNNDKSILDYLGAISEAQLAT